MSTTDAMAERLPAGRGPWEIRARGPVVTASGDAVAAWAADVLATWVGGWDCLPAPTALVVATREAGSREALAFWSAARATGLALAAPRAFPWTLANAPAGRISTELGITGPCTTLVGSGADEAFELARSIAVDEQDDDGPVLVVVLDPVAPAADAAPAPCPWELAAAVV